jgi:hypothetical protein
MIMDDFEKRMIDNYDSNTKCVGDVVIVWDAFMVFNENFEQICLDEGLYKNELIVIETDLCEFVGINDAGIKYIHLLDTKLYDKIDKIIVFTNSEYCKIIDYETKKTN